MRPRARWVQAILIGLSGATLLPGESWALQSASDRAAAGSFSSTSRNLPLEDAVRNRIEAGLTADLLAAAGEPLWATSSLPEFYRERAFEPAWVVDSRLTAEARELIQEIRALGGDGLTPAEYHLAALDSLVSLLDGGTDGSLLAQTDADLLLTDAFLVVGSHLLHGRVSPDSIRPEWLANRRGADMAEVLGEALRGGGVTATFDVLRPADTRYLNLQAALGGLRGIAAAGGWGTVPPGANLELGVRNSRVLALRSRLEASGDFPVRRDQVSDRSLFEGPVEEAVRNFQARHGLQVDGVVGPATLRALNVPVEGRIDQVEVNLERWRWLPEELGVRYFLVNPAGFSVELFENGVRFRRFRAIVGRTYRQTPVFSADMTYLVLAPYWHVPPGIAQSDQLPRIRENPAYVTDQRMVLIDAATNLAVDPHGVSWEGMTGAEFNRRFRLRQEPGPTNALGNVKFMFPNPHNVYIHDTPAQELFTREIRDFSSGCIRVERALDLAEYLLREDSGWTGERIRQVVARGVEQAVRLPTPYRVHVQYWTAWVDADGVLQFRDDIYNRDPAVRRALDMDPPSL